MIRLRTLSFPLVLALFASSLSASAATQRSFVSTSGNDANAATNCARSSPCRGLATALAVTSSGGEIIALDSGGYGGLAIDKSIAIVGAPGVYVGISVASGSGITIATPGIKVVLRGLSINGLGGVKGIELTNADSLSIENSVISNFTHSGLHVTAGTQVSITDTLFRDNSSGAVLEWGAKAKISNTYFVHNSGYGLILASQGSGTHTQAYLDRCTANGNGQGVSAFASANGGTYLSIAGSSISANAVAGVYAYSTGGSVQASVSGSVVSGNSDGLWASGSGAILAASGNTITRNGTGLVQLNSAVMESAGDNLVRNNSTLSSGTITATGKI